MRNRNITDGMEITQKKRKDILADVEEAER